MIETERLLIVDAVESEIDTIIEMETHKDNREILSGSVHMKNTRPRSRMKIICCWSLRRREDLADHRLCLDPLKSQV